MIRSNISIQVALSTVTKFASNCLEKHDTRYQQKRFQLQLTLKPSVILSLTTLLTFDRNLSMHPNVGAVLTINLKLLFLSDKLRHNPKSWVVISPNPYIIVSTQHCNKICIRTDCKQVIASKIIWPSYHVLRQQLQE